MTDEPRRGPIMPDVWWHFKTEWQNQPIAPMPTADERAAMDSKMDRLRVRSQIVDRLAQGEPASDLEDVVRDGVANKVRKWVDDLVGDDTREVLLEKAAALGLFD